MWEKILLALGSGATTLLASLAQMLHNRKIAERRQATEQRKISEERAAADAANAIAQERVAIEREASEDAQINAERRLAMEQQKALQELVRFYRDELAERMRLQGEMEGQLAATSAQLTAMAKELAAAHRALDAHAPVTAHAHDAVQQLAQGTIAPPAISSASDLDAETG